MNFASSKFRRAVFLLSFLGVLLLVGTACTGDEELNSNLENEVLKLAEKIASKSNKVLNIGKKAFYKQLEMPLEEAYRYTSEVMSENMLALDAKEGISAFLEKRTPNWKNK